MFDAVTRFLGDDVLDVRLRLPADPQGQFPGNGGQFPRLGRQTRSAPEADGRQRRPFLQTGLTPP